MRARDLLQQSGEFMDTSNQIKIFDTTMRDGQQCPGAGMTFEDNLRYAMLAAELGVDVLEAGFPAASTVDFQIVHAVAEKLSSLERSPVVAALCQLRSEQVDRTIESLLPAAKKGLGRMHTYVPVDPELAQASLGAKADNKVEIVKEVYEFVKRAVDAGLQVEFSPEGYSRMRENFDFVTDLIRAAVSAGASVINCPDTIGGAYRMQGPAYFVQQMKTHAEIIDREFPGNRVTWSAHCHNDFGLALDNSLNAVFAGPARQIEGCINGLGERAGNVALEQVIMVIRNFGAEAASSRGLTEPFFTNIDLTKLTAISNFVSEKMLKRQPHWPIVGENAARHSSGGHTNAIIRNPLVYQPFDPLEVGSEISLSFGPMSGGNHAKSVIEKAGYLCSDEEKATIAQFIKDFYQDRRKGVTDQELIRAYVTYRSPIRVDVIDYSKSANQSSVRIVGSFFGTEGEHKELYAGRDSALAALKKMVDRVFPGTGILSHKSRSHGEGIDAISVSTIVLSLGADSYKGIGEDQDIEISAMKALIDAVNKCYVELNFKKQN